jgi:hypothetical protein
VTNARPLASVPGLLLALGLVLRRVRRRARARA